MDTELKPMTAEQARVLTDAIKSAIDGVWRLIEKAWVRRAWDALDYGTWDEYCAAEFSHARLRIPRKERQEVVASMHDHGMSNNAIATAIGMNEITVRRDLQAGSTNVEGAESDKQSQKVTGTDASAEASAEEDVTPPKVTGVDGKTYPAARPAQDKPEQKPPVDAAWKDEAIVAWCARRVKAGRKGWQQLVHDADQELAGWPVPGYSLPVNAAQKIIAILEDRQDRPSGKTKDWDGRSNVTRLRDAKRDRRMAEHEARDNLLKFVIAVNQTSSALESWKPEDLPLDEVTVWDVELVYDSLISLGEWYDRTVSSVQGWLGDRDVRERIEKLRDTNGRTAEETATALRIADRLERKLGLRLVAPAE